MKMYFSRMLVTLILFLSKLKNVCFHKALQINLKRNKLFKCKQFMKHQIYTFVYRQRLSLSTLNLSFSLISQLRLSLNTQS